MTEDLFPSPHPLTPPHHEEEWLSWIRLLRSHRVGPTTFRRLLKEHGTATEALKVLPDVANAAGVKNYTLCSEETARRELHGAKLAGARPVVLGGEKYPALLAELKDAPPLLWTLGRAELLQSNMIALIGARNASSLGTRMARKLAVELGEASFTIVSGLARGIDAAAHIAALPKGTIAVQAGGVDVVYPAENAALAQEIGDQGLRISEQPLGLQPHARHFPQRNRIISGLCRAVIVVEAAGRSGSLITANCALDQGRDVLAVPGHPFDARAAGANFLIRDGATLVRSAADVIEFLAAEPAPKATANATPVLKTSTPSTRTLQDTAKLHQEILSRLGPSPVAEDQLIRDLKKTAAQVTPAIMTLELDGRVSRHAGGMLALASQA